MSASTELRTSDGSTTEPRSLLRDTNLRVIFAFTLMAVLGVSSVTPAFPRIVEALGISPREVGLLITVFTLPGVLLTPVLGVLADRWGRKRILIPSLLLFGLAGGACTMAPSFGALLFLRFLQGTGAAALGSLNVTLLGDLFSGERRAAAMGYNASVLSVGTAVYPLVGGGLAMLGWRYPFALPILAVPIAFIALVALDSPEPSAAGSLGAYLKGVMRGIATRQVLALFATSAVTFIILFGSYLTYFPFLMAHRFAATPLVIGLFMSAASLATALTSARLGALTRRFSEVRLIGAGFALYVLSLALVPLVKHELLLLFPVAVFGVAQGINIPSLMALLAGLAPLHQRAAFMSLNGMVLRLGQTAGPVIMGATFAAWGIDAVFLAGALLALAMLLVQGALPRA